MSNFKYSANINGSVVNKQRFVQDLELRGYKWREDFLEYEYPLCVNKVNNQSGFYRTGKPLILEIIPLI
jgi:hypothetical protein